MLEQWTQNENHFLVSLTVGSLIATNYTLNSTDKILIGTELSVSM